MRRDPEIRLVREFAARPDSGGVPSSRPAPILVFTGSRGSGKTAVLAQLAERLDQRIPHARVDVEATRHLSVPQRLAALTFELNRKCGQYGRLSFPRFVTGQLVLAQDLDSNDTLARRQLVQTLESYRNIDRLREFFSAVLADIAAVHQLPDNTVGYVPDLIVKGMTSVRWGRRVVLGWGQDWYGHRDRELGRDPFAELVHLNRKAHEPDADEDVHEVLWSALLADLREEFRRGRRAEERPINCVVLLDNVDNPSGRALLSGLMLARSRMRRADPEYGDPLTVVATSRNARPTWAITTLDAVPTVEEASSAHYETRRHREPDWYPVRLRELTRDEISDLVPSGRAHAGSSRDIATTVHRLTRGHPASTELLLDALDGDAADPRDLRSLLAVAPRPDSLTVEQRILDRFLPGVSDNVLEDLVTCAAVRTLDEALELNAPGTMLISAPGGERDEVYARQLWRFGERAGEATDTPAALPPVLRRLLLRRLAARNSDHPACWDRVYRWFRINSDEVNALHHALALGEVEDVTRWLAGRLRECDIAEWRDMLGTITSAPNRLDHGTEPLQHVQELSKRVRAEGDPVVAPLAWLVLGRWLEHDPLVRSDQRAHLLTSIAVAYEEIAFRNGFAGLAEDALRYRQAAERN